MSYILVLNWLKLSTILAIMFPKTKIFSSMALIPVNVQVENKKLGNVRGVRAKKSWTSEGQSQPKIYEVLLVEHETEEVSPFDKEKEDTLFARNRSIRIHLMTEDSCKTKTLL